jgi:hypothetical protein
METRLGEVTTTAALAGKKKLRKGFRRFDMICYTVVAVSLWHWKYRGTLCSGTGCRDLDRFIGVPVDASQLPDPGLHIFSIASQV